jgi:hypothetical protein
MCWASCRVTISREGATIRVGNGRQGRPVSRMAASNRPRGFGGRRFTRLTDGRASGLQVSQPGFWPRVAGRLLWAARRNVLYVALA